MRIDELIRAPVWQLARIAKLAIARNETQVSKASREIKCQISRVDVTRLTDHRSQNLVVIQAITTAKYRSAILTKPVGRKSNANARRKVVAIRIEDPRAARDECLQARRNLERRVVESAFDLSIHLAWRRVVFIPQAIRHRKVVAYAPLVLREKVELIKAQTDGRLTAGGQRLRETTGGRRRRKRLGSDEPIRVNQRSLRREIKLRRAIESDQRPRIARQLAVQFSPASIQAKRKAMCPQVVS